ncbi:MAG: hypothetical protein H7A45_14945 [Verrucomicrobiales bacterium]|nr:hypothetical protein [Verrucomicrobiales bacterium]MCP5526141.1 hypothetical protein [Verrucomicrobiales bacterium]
MMKKLTLTAWWVAAALPAVAQGQLVYAAPAQFGGVTGSGLFQVGNGQVVQLATGFVEHNWPSLSRDGRFVAFSSPDPVEPGLQVPPSSDVYLFDRVVGGTRRVVDHNTIVFNPAEVDSFTPVSAALSPDNQWLAYGVMLTRRQGTANPRSNRELNVARASDGVIVSNPTFGRGPVSDAFQAEFAGLAWDPAGDSFVTPSYVSVPTQNRSVQQLPAIVRFVRTPGAQDWLRVGVLSAPRYFDGLFPIAAETQIFPAISPSGAGLAYFSLAWPDVLGMSRGVIASVVIANADGSNARVLTTFSEGFYPLGLAWAPDGTRLVVSIARQAVLGFGFLPSGQASTAVLRHVATDNGSITAVPGVEAGYFPTHGALGGAGSLDGVALQIRSAGENGFVVSATGVAPASTYTMQSSPALGTEPFGPPQSFTGTQLLNGVSVPVLSPARFFRLINPGASPAPLNLPSR